MSTPPATARLHVLFARDAPVGVIFRRGPARQVRLILWRTDTDTFELGQWLKGDIQAEGAALSPNGRLLAYAAVNYARLNAWHGGQKDIAAWIAVSRPPYLTALGLWFIDWDFYGAATAFPDNQTLLVSKEGRASDKHQVPKRYTIGSLPSGGVEGATRGWRRLPRFGKVLLRYEKPLAGGDIVLESQSVGRDQWFLLRNRQSGQTQSLEADQVEVDPGGRLVLVRGGALAVARVSDDLELTETPLADFTDMVFEPIPPPDWATRWPEI